MLIEPYAQLLTSSDGASVLLSRQISTIQYTAVNGGKGRSTTDTLL